jgi:hypothetical protein
MQHDNYADLRIKDFTPEYPQVRAMPARSGIREMNIEQTEYPRREC